MYVYVFLHVCVCSIYTRLFFSLSLFLSLSLSPSPSLPLSLSLSAISICICITLGVKPPIPTSSLSDKGFSLEQQLELFAKAATQSPAAGRKQLGENSCGQESKGMAME